MNTPKNLESEIWKRIASSHLSPSHDHWHIDQVLCYARQLHEIHGGDWDVITAAVLMHDLGRNDPDNLHGEDSRRSSVKQADKVMRGLSLSKEKKEAVKQAILDHDQDDFIPHSVEARILKDADFLAGFGAQGILRIAMWAAETGGGMNQILDRLDNRMMRRVEGLEFDESKRFALTLVSFSNLFYASFRNNLCFSNYGDANSHIESNVGIHKRKGKYIVLEGVSGTGKNTLAELLEKRLILHGIPCAVVQEPTEEYKSYRDSWEHRNSEKLVDPKVMQHLLMADRQQLITHKVLPAIQRGDYVISIRSFLSTVVYQCENILDEKIATFEHSFVPIPDLLFVLDADEETCIKRIQNRAGRRGLYEKKEDLQKHRSKYKRFCECGQYALASILVDSSASVPHVFEQIWECIIRNNAELSKKANH